MKKITVITIIFLNILYKSLSTDFSDSDNELINKKWDIIIIGGGPVGLTTAKNFLNLNPKLNIILIEKNSFLEVSQTPRGETIEPDIIIDEIWGEGFLESLKIRYTQTNILYSPYSEKITYMSMMDSPYSFHWDNLILSSLKKLGYKSEDVAKKIITKIENSNLTICTGVSVLEPIFQFDEISNEILKIKGVRTTKGDIEGNNVFDCSGHNSIIGQSLGINYNLYNTPVFKCKGTLDKKNLSYLTFNQFRTFFIAADTIKDVTDAPPIFACIFPQETSNDLVTVEIVGMIFSNFGKYGLRWSNEPSINDEFLKHTWLKCKENYPVLSEIVKNINFKYEVLTYIPMKSMIKNPLVLPGLIMLGDSSGFVLSNSGSGLLTGMTDSKWWSAEINNLINNKISWNMSIKNKLNNDFAKSKVYKNVKLTHMETNFIQDLVFGFLINPAIINNSWALVEWGYGFQNQMLSNSYLSDIKMIETFPIERKSLIINTIVQKYFISDNEQKKIITLLKNEKSMLNLNDWNDLENSINIRTIYDKFTVDNLLLLFQIIDNSDYLDCAVYLSGKGNQYKSKEVVKRYKKERSK